MTKSRILYEGPSLLDGKPIVVVGVPQTRNEKTGAMVQTYILRADVDPLEANRSGEDHSICGECPLKGTPTHGNTGTARGRTCYVTLITAPLNVYNTYRRGRYKPVEDLRAFGAGHMIRIGTYGDGAAVPSEIWDELCNDAVGHTAYTHQGNSNPARFMTSVESLTQAGEAWDRGERTFRIIRDLNEMTRNEALCPASAEAGKRTTCASCKLCAGNSVRAKSIAIVAHGTSKKGLVDLLET